MSNYNGHAITKNREIELVVSKNKDFDKQVRERMFKYYSKMSKIKNVLNENNRVVIIKRIIRKRNFLEADNKKVKNKSKWN